jgi:hypothetical protein
MCLCYLQCGPSTEAALHSEPPYGDLRNLRGIALSRTNFDDFAREHFGEGIVTVATVNHAQRAEGICIRRFQSLNFLISSGPSLLPASKRLIGIAPPPLTPLIPGAVLIAQDRNNVHGRRTTGF